MKWLRDLNLAGKYLPKKHNKAMKFKLVRKWFTITSTIGELYVDGKFQCYTLEDVARPTDVKIKHQTCIPKGEYKIKVTRSNRYGKDMPLIYNRSDLSVTSEAGKRWSGIRIHSGNTDKDTSGCILPGTKKTKDFVSSSRVAYKALYEIIRKQTKLTKEISLIITHDQVV